LPRHIQQTGIDTDISIFAYIRNFVGKREVFVGEVLHIRQLAGRVTFLIDGRTFRRIVKIRELIFSGAYMACCKALEVQAEVIQIYLCGLIARPDIVRFIEIFETCNFCSVIGAELRYRGHRPGGIECCKLLLDRRRVGISRHRHFRGIVAQRLVDSR